MTWSVFSIFLPLKASLSSVMSLSVVSTPMSSLMSVSSSLSRRSSSIFLLMPSTDENDELILSCVLLSPFLKKPAVLVKIPIFVLTGVNFFISFAQVSLNFKS